MQRTSILGYVYTEGSPALADPGWVFVSFVHLRDTLNQIKTAETVEIRTLTGGATLLSSQEGDFVTEVRIHTVQRRTAAFKTHDVGPCFQELDLDWAADLDLRPFTLTMAPVILGATAIIPLPGAAMTWTMAYDPALPCHPRESFLKLLAGSAPEVLELTENGYFHFKSDGVHVFVTGHRSPGAGTTDLLAPAEDAQVALPAGRFIDALGQGIAMAGEGCPLIIGARNGIVVRNAFGGTNRLGLGATDPFPDFQISTKTAKLITDALKQPDGKEIMLRRLPGHPDILRLVRGGCEFSFRVLI